MKFPKGLSLIHLTLMLGALALVFVLGIIPPFAATTLVLSGHFEAISPPPLPGWISSLLDALKFTAIQAFASATLTVSLGLVLGRAASLRPGPLSRAFLNVAQVPFGLPGVVVVLGFILTYGNSGLINDALAPMGLRVPFLYNFWAIVFAHTFFNLGMCAKQVALDYTRIPHGQWLSAESMGLGSIKRFAVVEWPHLSPSLLNLWMLVFSLSLTSFAIVLILGGSPSLATLEVLIYQFVRYELDYTSAIGAAILQFMFLALVGLVSLHLQSRSPGLGQAVRSSARSLPLMNQNRFQSSLQALPLAGGLVWCALPLVMVVGHAAVSLRVMAEPEFRDALWLSLTQSLQVAIPTALLATATGFLLAQGAARAQDGGGFARKHGLRDMFLEVTSLGLLAISPTILGFSWYALLGFLEMGAFDHSTFVVILVQSFLLSPLAFRLLWPDVQARFESFRKQYTALGLPLGVQAWQVEFPALRGRLWSVLLLMVSFSIGEVAAPAMFGSPDFKPLSYYLLECLSSYEFERAGVITLVLLLLTQLTFYFGQKGASHA